MYKALISWWFVRRIFVPTYNSYNGSDVYVISDKYDSWNDGIGLCKERQM